jgi:hypothetical protein
MNEYLEESRRTYWKQLREMDPGEVARRALVSHEGEVYVVSCLNGEYRVDPMREKVFTSGGGEVSASDFAFLFVQYLIHAKDTPFTGEWITERDVKGGSLFFQGPHALPVKVLEEKFGYELGDFSQACSAAGGKELKPSFGDAGFEFQLFPRVLLAVVLWVGDDEFPPRVNVLFDRSLDGQFPLDVVLYMVNHVVQVLEEG